MAARGLGFTFAYGATKELGDQVGAWWQKERGYIQPAEFVIGRGSVVLGSMYASGPVGRMMPDEVIPLITSRERSRLEQERSEGGADS